MRDKPRIPTQSDQQIKDTIRPADQRHNQTSRSKTQSDQGREPRMCWRMFELEGNWNYQFNIWLQQRATVPLNWFGLHVLNVQEIQIWEMLTDELLFNWRSGSTTSPTTRASSGSASTIYAWVSDSIAWIPAYQIGLDKYFCMIGPIQLCYPLG